MKLNFKSVQTVKNIDLGTISRAGGSSTTKVTLPQTDFEGKELKGVSAQIPVIEGDSKQFKLKFAYQGTFSLAYSLENELTGKYDTMEQPHLAVVKLTNYAIENVPKEALDTEKDGKIIHFDYKKVDEAGKVVSEVKYDKEKKQWVKYTYNMPVFKERYDMRANLLKVELVGVQKDDKGTYKTTFDPHCYVSPAAVALYLGRKISKSGTPIPNSEGMYLVAVNPDAPGAIKLTPQKSSCKMSIAKMFDKVVCHPTYGIAKAESIDKNGLLPGKAGIEASASTIEVFNNDGEVVMKVDNAFKIGEYRATRTKNMNPTSEATIKENIKGDLTEVVETKEVEEDFFA